MNRRDFLKVTAALAANAAAPAIPGEPGLTVARMNGVVASLMEAERIANNGAYWALLRPEMLDDILKINARDRWYEAWRAWRVACRKGYLDLDARQVLAHFGRPEPVLDGDGKGGIVNGITYRPYEPTPFLPCEIGNYQGVRFIESHKFPP